MLIIVPHSRIAEKAPSASLRSDGFAPTYRLSTPPPSLS
jgi:hypothetical protein